jgi:hypothetical protein
MESLDLLIMTLILRKLLVLIFKKCFSSKLLRLFSTDFFTFRRNDIAIKHHKEEIVRPRRGRIYS